MSLKGRDPSDIESNSQPEPRRLFLHEPGWQVGLKVGSIRENCYQMAPGQEYYHRLSDGEIYIARADEKLCLACAARRGLLSSEAKSLREAIASFEYVAHLDSNPDIELGPAPTD